MFLFCLDNNRDFEVVQAYLSAFLKHHGETLINESSLLPLMEELQRKQRESWLRLQSMFDHSLCLIRHFSGIQT